MPTIFEPKDLPAIKKDGQSLTTLANMAMLGTDAMEVERIILDANASTSNFEAVNAERFLFVIHGAGQAHVGEQAFTLQAESLLWLETPDTFYLMAGADGLEVLLCRAPAGE